MHSEEELSDAVLHVVALQEADRVLIPEAACGATQFANLGEVTVLVRTSFSPRKSRRDEFGETIRSLLSRTANSGKLALEFETA